jgi:ribosomal 30S subunit maturation factor RimM
MPLIPLSRHPDANLPEYAVDIRGWIVRTAVDGEKAGKVDDILLDDHGRMRYLDVDLGLFNKHVLLPLTHAHVDGSEDVVWVDDLSKEQLAEIPEYAFDAQSLTPAYERRLEEDYRQAAAGEAIAERERERSERQIAAAENRLARLGDLDQLRVASDDADPRGWSVVTGDGEKIGKVDELIVDTMSMQARYLDCDVAEERLELEPLDRHILIPVDRSRLERGKKRVVIDGIFSRDVATYPVYGGLPLATDAEREIVSVYDRATTAATTSGVVASPAVDDTVATDFYRLRRGRPAGPEQRRAASATESAGGGAEETVITGADQEVRIRVSGSDIIIEKRPVD